MLTKAEKGYLVLSLCFLAAGSGIKAYRHTGMKLGPFPDPGFVQAKFASVSADSLRPDSAGPTMGDSAARAAAADGSPVDSIGRRSQSADPSGFVAVNDSSSGSGKPETRMINARSEVAKASRPHAHAGSPSGKSGFAGKVDVNRAQAAELTQVRGIGEKTAQAILDYRKVHGAFRDLRDLLQVKGIGEKKLEKLTPYLIL